MTLIKTDFTNRTYAKWIKDFQRKNTKTISFSNNINAINKTESIRIVSLNPLKIESQNISNKDYEMLSELNNYFNYLANELNTPNTNKIIISVEGTLYTLFKENEYINVIDTNDNDKTGEIYFAI